MTRRRQRILLVANGVPPQRIGGAELVAWRTAAALTRSGHAAAVLARDDAPDAQAGSLVRRESRGIVSYTLGADPERDSHPDARRAMGRVLSLWRPDAVWVHHPSGLGLSAVEPVLEDGLPLAVTFHDYWWMCPRGQLLDAGGDRCPGPRGDRCPPCLAPGAPRPLRRLTRALSARRWADHRRRARAILRAAQVLAAPSRHVAERHRAWLDTGIDVHPNPEPDLPRLPLPPATGPVRVGYLGSLLPSKGVDLLLEAAIRVGPGRVDLALHGPLPRGDRWREWRHTLRSLAVQAGARWGGPYSPAEVGTRLAQLEVVALPSAWEENAPLVLDEARATGRAVLASRIGGLPERLAAGATGRLLPPGDLDAWTAALADTTALRQLVHAAGRSPEQPPASDEAVEAMARQLTGR